MPWYDLFGKKKTKTPLDKCKEVCKGTVQIFDSLVEDNQNIYKAVDTLKEEIKLYREVMAMDSNLKKRFEFVSAKLDEQKTAAARTIQSWFRTAYVLKQHALTIQTWYRRCIHYKQKNAACRIQRFIRKRAQIRDSLDFGTPRKWRIPEHDDPHSPKFDCRIKFDEIMLLGNYNVPVLVCFWIYRRINNPTPLQSISVKWKKEIFEKEEVESVP